MPHLFPFANNDDPDEVDDMQELENSNNDVFSSEHKSARRRGNSVLGRISRFGHWLKKDADADERNVPHAEDAVPESDRSEDATQTASDAPSPASPGPSEDEEQRERSTSRPRRRPSWKVVPGLPRPLTFRRQNSEKRDRLLPVDPSPTERRALSADRRPRGLSASGRHSPPPRNSPFLSAPEVNSPPDYFQPRDDIPNNSSRSLSASGQDPERPLSHPPVPDPPAFAEHLQALEDAASNGLDDRELQAELESKWILNLSMHFRDKSDREKFFVTYAQEPNRWRRVTISCDYRDAQPESLEADVKSLHYQRDKSSRIYEAIRDSLPDIQFYDTVTNLKLETGAEDGRLHVHVTEDLNEIIHYPPRSLLEHVECDRYRESEIQFEAHLSGFVYRVSIDDRTYIKKEIPGPDTVDEFLYEVNALESLQGSRGVIDFHGLVMDEEGELVKGLLISYAPQGALVDIIYDFKGSDQLPWERRERWARQIVQGLSEIHEAGYVQGDFTLSNIVINADDNAKIIDINRRGCPVGWEPPELARLISSGQRISMCIGVKSDLFQLGMVLWALAEQNDEPERVSPGGGRLPELDNSVCPSYYRDIVESCLSERPQRRHSALELLRIFDDNIPEPHVAFVENLETSGSSFNSWRPVKQYVDPDSGITREDIEQSRRARTAPARSQQLSEPYTLADAAPSTDYYIVSGDRSLSPFNSRGRRSSPSAKTRSSATSVSDMDVKYIQSRSLSRGSAYPGGENELGRHEHDKAAPNTKDDDAPVGSFDGDSVQPASARHSRRNAPPHSLRADGSQYFMPPVHQDSGFYEYMADMDESSQGYSTAPPPPVSESERSSATAQSAEVTATRLPMRVLTDTTQLIPRPQQATPQSSPSPLTPSFHTPLASPCKAADATAHLDQAALAAPLEDVQEEPLPPPRTSPDEIQKQPHAADDNE